MLEEEIIELLENSGIRTSKEILEVPPQEEFGDIAFPCFDLAKIEKKNPQLIAEDIAKKIKISKNSLISKVESKGGYVNFFFNYLTLSKIILKNIIGKKGKYGSSAIGKNKKIVIDFSAPNIGKPMHVGHIRSTIIGDSLIKIYDFLGYKTIGINYLGDIGLHIGKIIVAYELWLNKKALKQDPIKELLRLYVKFCKQEKIEFQEGQDEEFGGNEWTDKAKEKLRLLESGDKRTIEVWHEIIKESKKGFDRVYKLLNVGFDEITGQSKFSDMGKEIVLEGVKKGIAKQEEDNAIYIELEKIPKKYILRSNGTASYITQDIGAAVERYEKYKFDKMIYVTDYRQESHFHQLFEILERFGYSFHDKCIHLPFGTVNFGKEIMSTREGKVVFLEDVLKKTIEKAEDEIRKRKTKGDAEKIGISSIKYIILKNDPIKDVEFSWESALSFEGNAGPYLQYAYTRCSGILGKSKKWKPSYSARELTNCEKTLVKILSRFPKIVEQSSNDLRPNYVCNYVYELAVAFNNFYENCPVIKAEKKIKNFRLTLVKSAQTVLKNCLELLGIEPVEKM